MNILYKLYLNMSGYYRSIIQTIILITLSASTGSIIERLINIDNSLRRIENKIEKHT